MSLAPVSLESAIAPSSKKFKVLLLENVHKVAVERFQESQYEITFLNKSLSEQELISIIPDYHVLGIRSVTEVNQKVIAAAKNLLVIGCFCIGTNQVDLKTARLHGIPVFNSPFSNSRSVAELIIAQVISLSRRLGDKNKELHSGIWNKSAINCHEVRGKTLGIVGYGHIGSQLSVLAEAMGMRVMFYDTLKKLPLGNSTQINSLDNLLGKSDFVSLHVPELDSTKNMMSKQKFALMKKGSYLLNASRGSVVVLEDLADAIKSGHIAGAYVDVYPEEPKMKVNDFKTPLQGLDNVLLTPHIGGSTEEAQEAIGVEVSGRIVSFINEGISEGAVNFPNIILQYNGPDTHRILNIHQNKPGVLRDINDVLSCYNIENQVLKTKGEIGYLLVEVDSNAHNEIQARIAGMTSSIRTRVLF